MPIETSPIGPTGPSYEVETLRGLLREALWYVKNDTESHPQNLEEPGRDLISRIEAVLELSPDGESRKKTYRSPTMTELPSSDPRVQAMLEKVRAIPPPPLSDPRVQAILHDDIRSPPDRA